MTRVGLSNLSKSLLSNDLLFNNSPSKLALNTKIESTMEIETEKKVEAGEEKIEVESSSNFTGFFSWTKTALVDGVEREVRSTLLLEDPEEKSEEIYLIYERGNSISHDPKIGFVTVTLPKVGTIPYVIYFVIGVAILGIVAFWFLKKR